ncbi:nitrous oxide-stimulated promoter family protein [Psychromonas aquimarina]|uniref:nitrous oxide-stimulated promoter family protein n=1 Tax=Psychromonas aquimarina TaxID=444919 RepID=UPI0004018F0D|nr:nitrous oxide-stimulated promoter family protein [Psychromonas aquimarina]
MGKQHFLPAKLGIEFKTIKAMVKIYCRAHHNSSKESAPCADCREFIDYANEKLDRCPYGQNKPTCNKCPIHCYKKEQREQAGKIMRYAGPRMLLRHPVLAVKHLLAEKAPVPESYASKSSNRHLRKSEGREKS